MLLLWSGLGIAQDVDDIIRPFFGYYNSQSLTTAVGNATVASGQVISGMSSNPANLGLSRFNVLQANFMFGQFESGSATSSQTEFGGLYAIAPLKVYQGSMVFGFGIEKIIDFSKAWERTNDSFREEGGLYATQFGMSVEFAEDFFVGGSFDYYQGSDLISRSLGSSELMLKPKYKGYGITIGFLNRISSIYQIGASVQFPTSIWVSENQTEWQINFPEMVLGETWEYQLKRPLVFHFGGSLLIRTFNLFYEAEWTNWKDMEFDSDTYLVSDIATINREIDDQLKSTLTHHLGIALHPHWAPLHLYLGYQYLPTPNSNAYLEDVRQSMSIGSAYMLNQQFSLHGSITNYFGEYYGEDETYSQLIFGVSVHY